MKTITYALKKKKKLRKVFLYNKYNIKKESFLLQQRVKEPFRFQVIVGQNYIPLFLLFIRTYSVSFATSLVKNFFIPTP